MTIKLLNFDNSSSDREFEQDPIDYFSIERGLSQECSQMSEEADVIW